MTGTSSEAASGIDASIEPQHLMIVLPTTGEFDSRTYRIARTGVERGHRVTVVARWAAGLARDETHALGFRVLRYAIPTPFGAPGESTAGIRGTLRAIARRVAFPLTVMAQRRAVRRLAPRADLVHGMAFMGIPIALSVGKRDGVPVVYDARDIHLDARNMARMGRPARWFLGRAERGWAVRSSRVITVNDAYADVLASRWPIGRPLVVMNCSYRFTPPLPRQRRFHETLGLPPGQRVVLYHGGLFPWRGIEQLIEAIRGVPDATLVLMGYGILEPTLRAWEADPDLAGRVRVMGPVPPAELHDWVAAADVAGMPIQGDTLNHRLTTPNKLFEAMAAGVPAVVSDLPGMSSVVHDADSGILVDPTDVSAITAAIRRILDLPPDEWLAWSDRCVAAAHDRYNWETQAGGLLDLYTELTGKRW
jgi:glycosyltransferase involved in cell wall biosynthesis